MRLHSCRAYFDMPAFLTKFPKIKANFNLTPSLLIQLKDYIENDVRDDYFDVSIKPAAHLNMEEKKFILSSFFMANWDTMIAKIPRYLELLEKRGRFYTPSIFEKIVRKFTDTDFRDLQALFNLTWFGFMKEKEDSVIAGLFKKGANFTEEDKKLVLSRQRETMAELIPLYKKLAADGQIEISTTPYYHPILPILYSGGTGQGFDFKEDASMHVEKAVKLCEEVFGTKPKGMWPAEGSVSQSIIPLIAGQGIEWIATDEEILTESLKGRERDELMYKPYIVKEKDMKLKILFRDKNLSNLISFVYSRNNPEQAAQDLIGHLKRIADATSNRKGEGIVPIILDGENPWEYYAGGGEAFLSNLYTNLSKEEGIKCVTISEYLNEADRFEEIPVLTSGSWIDHSFRIWIGKPEKDMAWKYLIDTRSYLAEDSPEEAWEELYIAEGSDWFWWYGDDFTSANDEAFDLLFRTHLMNVHRRIGREIPSYLYQAIISKGRASLKREPAGSISPVLDGKATDFYEWLEAGLFKIDEAGGTMHLGTSILKEIRFGFDRDFLYFRFDLSLRPADKSFLKTIIAAEFSEPLGTSLEIPLGEVREIKVIKRQDGHELIKNLAGLYALGEIVEAKIAWNEIITGAPSEIRFVIRVKKENMVYETWPRSGYISFAYPDENYEAKNWSV